MTYLTRWARGAALCAVVAAAFAVLAPRTADARVVESRTFGLWEYQHFVGDIEWCGVKTNWPNDKMVLTIRLRYDTLDYFFYNQDWNLTTNRRMGDTIFVFRQSRVLCRYRDAEFEPGAVRDVPDPRVGFRAPLQGRAPHEAGISDQPIHRREPERVEQGGRGRDPLLESLPELIPRGRPQGAAAQALQGPPSAGLVVFRNTPPLGHPVHRMVTVRTDALPHPGIPVWAARTPEEWESDAER